MAARATRLASRKARATEAVATGPFGALSHDELGVIFDGLADPLQPVVAVALSSTCLGLRTPLQAALAVLKERHARAAALCRKIRRNCAELCGAFSLREATAVDLRNGLTVNDMATFGMILRTNGLPRLRELRLDYNISVVGDAGIQALFEGLGRGAGPSICYLNLCHSQLGPASAEALAAAFLRGALPNLEKLHLGNNHLGNQGMAALAPALRQLPALVALRLSENGLGDEGVASLVANLGKDDFRKLERLWLDRNETTDRGCTMLVSAIDGDRMPLINKIPDVSAWGDDVGFNASDAARQAVYDALARARARRAS